LVPVLGDASYRSGSGGARASNATVFGDPALPWHVSLLTVVSGVFLALRPNWREKSDVWYGRERTVDQLINRLKYQIANPNPDQVAQIAKEFDQAKAVFGNRMHEINARQDKARRRNALRDG
jgi:hypothetical protein